MKSLFILIIYTILSISVYGQACKDFHLNKRCIPAEGNDFNLYGQSRSKVIEIGVLAKHTVVLYGKKDYILSFCTERNLYPIHYKLVDDETNEVLFDNIEDDYIESIGFTIDNTITVNIEITVLADGFQPESFIDNRSCIGLLILWKKTPKIGF